MAFALPQECEGRRLPPSSVLHKSEAKRVRVICTDPEATDSSADELDFSSRRLNRKVQDVYKSPCAAGNVAEERIGRRGSSKSRVERGKRKQDHLGRVLYGSAADLEEEEEVRGTPWGKWAAEIQNPLGTFLTAKHGTVNAYNSCWAASKLKSICREATSFNDTLMGRNCPFPTVAHEQELLPLHLMEITSSSLLELMVPASIDSVSSPAGCRNTDPSSSSKQKGKLQYSQWKRLDCKLDSSSYYTPARCLFPNGTSGPDSAPDEHDKYKCTASQPNLRSTAIALDDFFEASAFQNACSKMAESLKDVEVLGLAEVDLLFNDDQLFDFI